MLRESSGGIGRAGPTRVAQKAARQIVGPFALSPAHTRKCDS